MKNIFKDKLIEFIHKQIKAKDVIEAINTLDAEQLDQALLIAKELSDVIKKVQEAAKKHMIDDQMVLTNFYVDTRSGKRLFTNLPLLLTVLTDKFGLTVDKLASGEALTLSVPKTETLGSAALMLRDSLSKEEAATQVQDILKPFIEAGEDVKALEKRK